VAAEPDSEAQAAQPGLPGQGATRRRAAAAG
jgi:hypothetical protein